MVNKLKQRLKSGKAAINGWLHIPDGFAAETMAQGGWHSLTVDLQHGVQDYQSMIRCFQAAAAHPPTLLARAPWNEPGIIGKVLDGGALGVIAPMINSRTEAEALVSYAKYPPAGKRSNGPIRAGVYGAAGAYQKTANDEVLVIPMIETAEALDHLEAILDVKGIDMIYVGPSDLAFSLGLEPALDREEKQVLEIYERLIRETGKRGIYAGIHTGNPAYAARMLRLGFRLVTVGGDANFLASGSRQAIAGVRDVVGDLLG